MLGNQWMTRLTAVSMLFKLFLHLNRKELVEAASQGIILPMPASGIRREIIRFLSNDALAQVVLSDSSWNAHRLFREACAEIEIEARLLGEDLKKSVHTFEETLAILHHATRKARKATV